jgi:hypothetical protein
MLNSPIENGTVCATRILPCLTKPNAV